MSEARDGLGARALVAAAFLALAFAIYAPALRGPFLSDDLHYVRENPYVQTWSAENLRQILSPRSDAASMVENWSPLHLLLHGVVWQAAGPEVLGHHVVNVMLHTIASLLFALLLRRSGALPEAALAGGALFLLHPANVEAVAWISQLKSSAALVLSLAALLLHPVRPAAGFVCFGLALLAKPTAAFALPVALLFTAQGRDEERRSWAWLGAWGLAFAAFAGIELGVFHRSGQDIHPVDPDLWVRARTIVANGGRYLAMAATGQGLSTFHDPEPASSPLDPRFLFGLVAIGGLGARTAIALRRRSAEAAYWIWAAVSFAPVSQVFPFLYPVADRYLYFILPGLLGGAVLATQDGVARIGARFGPAVARRAALGLALGAAALGVSFAIASHARARIWTSSALVFADSAAHYPRGVAAELLRARRAAQAGDAGETAACLDRAFGRGFAYFEQITGDPAFAPVRDDARVRASLRAMEDWWIDRIRRLDRPTQAELALLARALVLRGERDEARRVLERAAAQGGPADAQVRRQLAELGVAGQDAR